MAAGFRSRTTVLTLCPRGNSLGSHSSTPGTGPWHNVSTAPYRRSLDEPSDGGETAPERIGGTPGRTNGKGMTMKRTLVVLLAVVTAILAWGGGIAAAQPTNTPARPTNKPTPSPGGRPMIAASQPSAGLPTLSLNWSGYAVTDAAKFNYVHSEFVQPAIKCTGAPDRFTSNWVGLDGFTSDSVEQDGTDAWCGGPIDTTPFYKAWYEMYPARSYSVFSVSPATSSIPPWTMPRGSTPSRCRTCPPTRATPT